MEKAKNLLHSENRIKERLSQLEREISGVDSILTCGTVSNRIVSKYDDEMIRLQKEYHELSGSYFPTEYSRRDKK